MAQAKRKISCLSLPLQQQLPFEHEGRYFDLRAIFDKLNAKYFSNSLRRYRVVWGRRRKKRPKTYFVFASILEGDRLIRVHPLLDAPFVPRWFLEYVLYHEMLHAVVPDEFDQNGRRRVHTDKFNTRERRFPLYHRARRWEMENLGRFLR